jgi:hypothetical protein
MFSDIIIDFCVITQLGGENVMLPAAVDAVEIMYGELSA